MYIQLPLSTCFAKLPDALYCAQLHKQIFFFKHFEQNVLPYKAFSTLLNTAPEKGEHNYLTIQHHYRRNYSFLTHIIFSSITLNHFQLQIPLPFYLSTISFTMKSNTLPFLIISYIKIPHLTIFLNNFIYQNPTPYHFLTISYIKISHLTIF